MPEHILPEGFGLQACESIGLTVPVPNDWEHRLIDQGGQHIFAPGFVELGDELLSSDEVCMTVSKFPQLNAGVTVLEAARYIATRPTEMTPVSDIEETERDSFHIYQRQYVSTASSVLGLHVGKKLFSIAGIADKQRNELYMVAFEVPKAKWEEMQDIGRTMLTHMRQL